MQMEGRLTKSLSVCHKLFTQKQIWKILRSDQNQALYMLTGGTSGMENLVLN